jgi:hypothetical protein
LKQTNKQTNMGVRAGLRGRQKKLSKGKLEWNKDRKGHRR